MKQKPAENILTAIPSIEYLEHQLENGLRIVLSRNTNIPNVAVNTTFHVGSKDDHPDLTGMAHLFEHLMFEGSPNVPKGMFDEILNNNGGESNAYTTWDTTSYFICLPSTHLEVAFWLDSDRIAGFGITEEALRVQKDVVAEEKLMYIDNAPYGSVEEESGKRLFANSGYRFPIIGNMNDLMKVEIDDLRIFHKKFYTPSNAVISVVGDIDYDETLRLIEKYYGGITPGPKLISQEYSELPLTAEQVCDIEDNVQLEGKFIFYRTPEAGTKDYYALNLLSGILTESESSRLVHELEYEKELVHEIDTAVYGHEKTGIFMISAFVLKGKSSNEVAKRIDDCIDDIKNGNISDVELTKIKNRIETYFSSGMQSIIGLADKFSFLKTLYNDCDRINSEVVNYLSVSKEEIVQAANRHLNINQRVVLNYFPKG
jgi:predicted Zn-dependent peptidase